MEIRTGRPDNLLSAGLCIIAFSSLWLLSGWAAGGRPDSLSNHRASRHFDISTDMDQSMAESYILFMEEFRSYFENNYFKIKSTKRLEVYLFKDEQSYQPYARSVLGDYTPYGFYEGRRVNRIVINNMSGLGTVSHELVHYFIDAGFETDPPAWVDEGIATFFEKFIGYYDERNKLHLTVGYFSNWRFPKTKSSVKTLNLQKLLASPSPEQSQLRSFSLFLHKRGVFKECVRQWQKETRPDGWIKVVETAYGKPIVQIGEEWKEWIESQAIDGDVLLVPFAFVKGYQQWQEWLEFYKDKVYWSENEGVYRARKTSDATATDYNTSREPPMPLIIRRKW